MRVYTTHVLSQGSASSGAGTAPSGSAEAHDNGEGERNGAVCVVVMPSRLEWHVHPPYIPIRHRRASSCAPIGRLHSAYGSWVFVSIGLVQELIWPCHDYDIVGRREPT